MNRSQRAEKLKNWGLEAGFDRVGVASLQPSDNGAYLKEWLDSGQQAGMGYLEHRIEVRLDPRELFPGASSVLCVALQYHPLLDAAGGATHGDLWPRVARYAHGMDYHQIMERALRRLAERVEAAFPGTTTRVYVDTGPVLERELAARAGLGAVGKNTNLLHPAGGSWFLLGELFCSLDLDPDPPAADLCGSCTECLDACPTGALPRPYRLDSRRCISYWTIEHRGSLPVEVRSLLGDWVFGCDICQEVCPVNADPSPGGHAELTLPDDRARLDLAALLNLPRVDYVELFRGSAMKRAKLEGLQRNAAVVMGNSQSPRYLPALIEALHHPEALVRRHVAWALGQIGGNAAEEALRGARAGETDEEVRDEIDEALAIVER